MSARRPLRVAAFILAALGVMAQAAVAEAPARSPRPLIRPDLMVTAHRVEATARSTGRVAIAASLRPAERPEKLFRVASERRRAVIAGNSKGGRVALCGDPEIVGNAIQPIPAKLDGCGLSDGVMVISVAGVALTTPASVDCRTARALKTWIESGVKPAFHRKRGGVHALRVAASYSCRTRNNVKGAKVSEHGRGRAIDISAVLLGDGSVVTVENGWGSKKHGKALSTMRSAACGPFKTVLGPGSDRYHDDHFHLDTARRRGAYCR
ncbi:hypothetical protein DEA8626_00479 [Defluviimonas aquaemixtae]|uniref:Extensin-like C-terminal domain-containing protein n=1 Tax=Albidovulum aquaemixtae TaxID=1542388 RepID=A0A2R8B318_9RHOB|nr:extensin family protein [Defluviimonas aquaemixtae]SPH16965.1 hypothetical protein DEA8626_00479 [Defluviimonas aquaemixtae]